MGIVTCNLEYASYFSGGPPVVSLPINPVFNAPETAVERHIIMCQCAYCGREYALDQQTLKPPAFCGEGVGGACGALEWRFFKRLIEVVDESDKGMPTGVISLLDPPCSEEAIDQLRETWKRQLIDMTLAEWRGVSQWS